MNNEPVAWMDEDENVVFEKCKAYPIPLYTHPAETITLAELRKTELYRTEQTRSLREFLEPKKLTDEEINWLAKAYSTMEGELNAPAFARAILRKAQEK
jgi:hypothetical protein